MMTPHPRAPSVRPRAIPRAGRRRSGAAGRVMGGAAGEMFDGFLRDFRGKGHLLRGNASVRGHGWADVAFSIDISGYG